MKLKVQLVSVVDGHEDVREVADLERRDLQPETLGLTLSESKRILKGLQEALVEWQTTAYLEGQRHCPHCGKARHVKDSHRITVRTLFGNLRIDSPRLHHCDCQPYATKTFSPLAERLPERSTPEQLFLEAKWTSLMPFGAAAGLFKDVLPIEGYVRDTCNSESLQPSAE